MQNTVWCHPAVVTESSCYSFWQNTVVLNISAMELLGVNRTGTRVCLPSRALSSLPTGLSYPSGELCKDTPLGNRKRSCTSLELKMQFKHTHGCAADRFKYLRRVHCYFYELVNEYMYILNIFIYKYYLHYYILYIYILFILYIY